MPQRKQLSFQKLLALAFLLSFVIIGLQVAKKDPRIPYADEYRYLGLAVNLADHNVFSSLSSDEEGRPNIGMGWSPATPAIFSWYMQIDPAFSTTMHCYVTSPNDKSCGTNYGGFLYFQILLASLAATLIWLTLRQANFSSSIQWLGLFIALTTGLYARYANHFLTETYIFLFFNLFLYFLVLAVQKHSTILWACVGCALGLCALTRPSYSYLAYAFVGTMALISILISYKASNSDLSFKNRAGYILAVIIGFGAVTLPWMLRNYQEFGVFALTHGYAGDNLSQRLAYNSMTLKEWISAWIFWLPDFGDSLARDLFGEENINRLRWDSQEGFYLIGNTEFKSATAQAANNAGQSHLAYLIRNYVLGDIFTFASVTLVMIWRGLWIGKYFGLVAHILSIPALRICHNINQLKWLTLIAMPALFMVLFHASVSVSIPRYNIVMLPYLSCVSAIVIIQLYEYFRKKIKYKLPVFSLRKSKC